MNFLINSEIEKKVILNSQFSILNLPMFLGNEQPVRI